MGSEAALLEAKRQCFQTELRLRMLRKSIKTIAKMIEAKVPWPGTQAEAAFQSGSTSIKTLPVVG